MCVARVPECVWCGRMQGLMDTGCMNDTGIELMNDGRCITALLRDYEINNVDVRDFESALVNAVDHSGHRLRHRSYLPIRDPSTPTGWKRA